MNNSKQILLDIEEEAIHVWREWPQYLMLKMRRKEQLASLQRGENAPPQTVQPDEWLAEEREQSNE